jgi:hypothetical protein
MNPNPFETLVTGSTITFASKTDGYIYLNVYNRRGLFTAGLKSPTYT